MNNVFTIEKLFADRMFRVPDYQRGYAWEKEQLDEFIDDIELLPIDKDHYTGTLVLHDQGGGEPSCVDEEGKHYALAEVVDGQQRLTTIILLLDAIRHEMSRIESLAKLAEGIRKSYVAATNPANQPMYKLVLNRDCHDYFVKSVLSDLPSPQGPVIQSHRRLSEAKERFAKYLKENRHQLGEEYGEWLKELRKRWYIT